MLLEPVTAQQAYRKAYRRARQARSYVHYDTDRYRADEQEFININGDAKAYLFSAAFDSLDFREQSFGGWLNECRQVHWFNHVAWERVIIKMYWTRMRWLEDNNFCACREPDYKWHPDERVTRCRTCGKQWGNAPF